MTDDHVRNNGSRSSAARLAEEVHAATTSPRFVLGLVHMGPAPLPVDDEGEALFSLVGGVNISR